jgi:hypothetical protein
MKAEAEGGRAVPKAVSLGLNSVNGQGPWCPANSAQSMHQNPVVFMPMERRCAITQIPSDIRFVYQSNKSQKNKSIRDTGSRGCALLVQDQIHPPQKTPPPDWVGNGDRPGQTFHLHNRIKID